MLNEWVMVWINTCRFGKPGIARRQKKDVEKYCGQIDFLTMIVTQIYKLHFSSYGDQYILSRDPL